MCHCFRMLFARMVTRPVTSLLIAIFGIVRANRNKINWKSNGVRAWNLLLLLTQDLAKMTDRIDLKTEDRDVLILNYETHYS